MNTAELRRRVGVILAVEEKNLPDWAEVERLTDELQQQLLNEPETECPEVVSHYLDDWDVRSKDEAYAQQQRAEVRRFVKTGEYLDSTPVPLWTCAIALLLVIALIGGLLW